MRGGVVSTPPLLYMDKLCYSGITWNIRGSTDYCELIIDNIRFGTCGLCYSADYKMDEEIKTTLLRRMSQEGCVLYGG